MPVTFVKHTNLDYAIAEEFFGWKWMSHVGIPVRGTPGYPQECRVQIFMSPSMLQNDRWKSHLEDKDAREADGTEPLDYCYCSSGGFPCPPHPSGDMADTHLVEKEIRKRKLWKQYREQLWCQVVGHPIEAVSTINEAKLADATCEQRCIAALAVVGSKHVVPLGTP